MTRGKWIAHTFETSWTDLFFPEDQLTFERKKIDRIKKMPEKLQAN